MDNGQRTTDRGQQTVDNGQWTTDSGQRTVDNGQWTKNRLHLFWSVVRCPLSVVLLFLALCPLFLVPQFLFASSWHPPHIQKITLSNGFRIYLLPDHTLPLFRAKLFVEAGQAYEPSAKTGLADLLATLLVTGGTKEKEPQAVDVWLDQNAISFSSDAKMELTVLTLSCLAAQQKEGMAFLKEALWEPRLDPERLQLAKRQYLEALRRDKDQPLTIVSKEFRKLVYGKNHPWGREATSKTIKKIQREDLLNFYQSHFHPNRMLLAVAGDFSPKEIKAWAAENFGPLPRREVEKPEWPELDFQISSEEKKIKMNLTQSFIEAGHLSLKRDDPDRYAYELLQYILGGDVFTSRLGQDIRTTLGLAYSVYSSWETSPVRGMFRIHVETRKEAEATVLERIQFHLKKVSQEADILQTELDRAKEALVNQYIFWFESPFEVIATQARLDLLGYEEDYLQSYPKKIKGVTLEKLKEVAKETIKPEGVKIVIVGP